MAPSAVPTLVQACRQNVEVPQMSYPQERHMKEHR